LGGGQKGLFLILRYVYIVAASYLLIFQAPHVAPTQGVMIAAALASNVALSIIPAELLFSWYVEAPVLIADTLWVSWALHSTGAAGQELFLLYFFVLLLAALGDSLAMVLLGSTLVSVANMYFTVDGTLWTAPTLLRVVFFYTVALFYGHVIMRIKQERQRASKGVVWAKELEAKVAERTAELVSLYEAAQAAIRVKSEFVGNMSHELRTPLNIIMGYTQLLLAGPNHLGDEEREMVERILAAGQSQARLVNSVLDLGRMEAGNMSVDIQPVALEHFVWEFQQRPRLPLPASVNLQFRVDPDLPLIETDPTKLAVILDNLLNNAIKFISAGAITVSIRNLPQQKRVEFRVDDTGPGIAAKDVPVIFEAFRQIDGSSTRRHGGLGLGLTIVRGSVELLGGEITVNSQPGVGTSFIVTLPYRYPYPWGLEQPQPQRERNHPEA